jgi:hypothetical protein
MECDDVVENIPDCPGSMIRACVMQKSFASRSFGGMWSTVSAAARLQ